MAIVLVVLFLAAIFYGLSSRGLRLGDDDLGFTPGSRPASTHADQLKEGVPDGIIGEPVQPQPQRIPSEPAEPEENPFMPEPPDASTAEQQQTALEPEEIWRARLEREQEEQLMRELHRQRMARYQANDAAFDSPIAVSLRDLSADSTDGIGAAPGDPQATAGRPQSGLDLYAAAMEAGVGGATDANGQAAKERFFSQDIRDLGYLPNPVR